MSLPVNLNARFISETVPHNLLEDMVEWIGANLAPEDVFDDEALSDWASDAGYSRDDE
jgi:hypothetical protein